MNTSITNITAPAFELKGQQLSSLFADAMKSMISVANLPSSSLSFSFSSSSSLAELKTVEESKSADYEDETTATKAATTPVALLKPKEDAKTCAVIQPLINFCAICAEPTACEQSYLSSPSEEEKDSSFLNFNSEYTLSCQCKLHIDCLNGYIRNQIGDRNQMNLCGIACPNGRSCKHYTSSSLLLDKSFELDEANDLFQSSSSVVVSPFFITVPDLRLINNFNKDVEKEGEFSALSNDEIDRFDNWLTEQKQGPSKVNSDDCDPYVLATTKPCPTCNFRSTHYQGHKCHHISPSSGRNSRGGCPNCHKNYCYKCLCSAKDNLRDRGVKEVCACGFWSSFCDPIRTVKTVEKHISYNNGIPCDSRCGCTIW